MSKLGAIVLTAAICLPLGAIIRNQASADTLQPIDDDPPAGRHFGRAQRALHEALVEVTTSQRVGEDVWRDKGSHGQPAKDAIDNAVRVVDRAIEWTSTASEGPTLMYVRLIDGRFVVRQRDVLVVP
jgi:hypothetical protein